MVSYNSGGETRRSYLGKAGGAALLSTGLAGCTGVIGGGGSGLNTIGAAIPQTGNLSDFGGQFERQAGFALDIVNDAETD